MARKKGKSLFSLTTILASFFGAAMIAGAFAYFNYKFAEYKFIDFKEWVFYEDRSIFEPSQERYLVLFYSSKATDVADRLKNVESKYPILAIDFYQQNFKSSENIHFVRAGSNTILKVIQRFNIYEVPSIFLIKQTNKTLFKQDSMVHKLQKIDDLQDSIQKL